MSEQERPQEWSRTVYYAGQVVLVRPEVMIELGLRPGQSIDANQLGAVLEANYRSIKREFEQSKWPN